MARCCQQLVEAPMISGPWYSTAAAASMAILGITACNAGYEGPMRFSVFSPCAGNSELCAPRVLAEGVIQADTPRTFRTFLEKKRKHEHELTPQPTVSFDS